MKYKKNYNLESVSTKNEKNFSPMAYVPTPYAHRADPSLHMTSGIQKNNLFRAPTGPQPTPARCGSSPLRSHHRCRAGSRRTESVEAGTSSPRARARRRRCPELHPPTAFPRWMHLATHPRATPATQPVSRSPTRCRAMNTDSVPPAHRPLVR
jgi:hypothetical protein